MVVIGVSTKFGVDLKKQSNLKVESYVLLGGIFRNLSPGDSISSGPMRTVLVRGHRGQVI